MALLDDIETLQEEALPGSASRRRLPSATEPEPTIAPDDLAVLDRPISAWARVGRVFVLLLSDHAALLAVACFAYAAWAAPVHQQPAALYVRLLPMAPLFAVGYALLGLYPGFGLGAVESLRRLSVATSFVFVAIAALVFVLKVPHQYSRMTFILMWCGALVFVPAARYLIVTQASRLRWWHEPCVVVGEATQLQSTLETLQGAVSVGYRAIAVLATDRRPWGDALRGYPVFTGSEGARFLSSHGIHVAIVDDEQLVGRQLRQSLQREFRRVIVLRDIEDMEIAEPRYMGGVFGFEFRNELLRRRSRFLKRSVDIIVGAAGLALSLPLIVIALAAVRIHTAGPGLFRQVRVGRDHRPFTLLKIRTMVPDADARLEDVLSVDPERRAEWNEGFKLREDPRIIGRVGRFLRRFSLDELPQLWNVLRGDMSLVGPRPLPEYHVRNFTPELRELRLRVRPGMTGLWQVTARGDSSAQSQQIGDEYYVRNWSVWLDIYILIRTALDVQTRRGVR